AADSELAAAGEEIDVGDLVTLPAPERVVRDLTAAGEGVTVDRVGNVQLSLTGADAGQIGGKRGGTVLVHLGHRQLTLPCRDTFGAVATGELVTYTDSAGLVSVAVNGGNAAQRLGLPPGARVSITAVPRLLMDDRIPRPAGAWHD